MLIINFYNICNFYSYIYHAFSLFIVSIKLGKHKAKFFTAKFNVNVAI